MSATPNANSSAKWTSSHVFLQAAICLVLGVMVGFLIRGPRTASAARRATSGNAPPVTGSMAGVKQVTPNQLKHMADKQAQPLLAQLWSTPNDPELLAKLGYIYYVTRNFNEASGYYKRSVAIKDNAVVRTELGRAYYYAGDPDSAIAEFEKVLKVDPNNANALYNLGLIKWQHKFDADAAVAAWQQLLKKNPNHPRRAEVEKLIAEAKQHTTFKTQ